MTSEISAVKVHGRLAQTLVENTDWGGGGTILSTCPYCVHSNCRIGRNTFLRNTLGASDSLICEIRDLIETGNDEAAQSLQLLR